MYSLLRVSLYMVMNLRGGGDTWGDRRCVEGMYMVMDGRGWGDRRWVEGRCIPGYGRNGMMGEIDGR